MSPRPGSAPYRKGMMLVALLTIASLAVSCSDPPGEGSTATSDQDGGILPGTETPGDGVSPDVESPQPEDGGDAAQEDPGQDQGTPPEPGQPTAVAFQEEARGAESVDTFDEPRLLLARSPQEAERLATLTPISGPDTVVQRWGRYDERALVVVLGGSQPDPSFDVKVKSTQFIKNGTTLLLFGRITRERGQGGGTLTMPWVVLSVDAGAADVVSRCILALKRQATRTSACP